MLEKVQQRVLQQMHHLVNLWETRCPVGTRVEGTDGFHKPFTTTTTGLAFISSGMVVGVDLANGKKAFPCLRLKILEVPQARPAPNTLPVATPVATPVPYEHGGTKDPFAIPEEEELPSNS